MLAFMREYIPGHTEGEIRAAFSERFGIVLTAVREGAGAVEQGEEAGRLHVARGHRADARHAVP